MGASSSGRVRPERGGARSSEHRGRVGGSPKALQEGLWWTSFVALPCAYSGVGAVLQSSSWLRNLVRGYRVMIPTLWKRLRGTCDWSLTLC